MSLPRSAFQSWDPSPWPQSICSGSNPFHTSPSIPLRPAHCSLHHVCMQHLLPYRSIDPLLTPPYLAPVLASAACAGSNFFLTALLTTTHPGLPLPHVQAQLGALGFDAEELRRLEGEREALRPQLRNAREEVERLSHEAAGVGLGVRMHDGR
eukprot:365172-Chlamydomonas_euryale.AAC.1